MTIAIRPPKTSELALVRATWRQQMRPRFLDTGEMGAGFRGHCWGEDRFVTQKTLNNMFRRHMDDYSTRENVLVCGVPVDGEVEALGWICRSTGYERNRCCVVHFVYVLESARREGLGSALLRYVRQEARTAGLDCVPGCMTGDGVSLWESEKSQ